MISLIQDCEADFLWKVSLKILNSGRALTPLFENGAGAHGIEKISNVLTKIGKLDIVLMDVSIARLTCLCVLCKKGEKEASVIVFYYSG